MGAAASAPLQTKRKPAMRTRLASLPMRLSQPRPGACLSHCAEGELRVGPQRCFDCGDSNSKTKHGAARKRKNSPDHKTSSEQCHDDSRLPPLCVFVRFVCDINTSQPNQLKGCLNWHAPCVIDPPHFAFLVDLSITSMAASLQPLTAAPCRTPLARM